MSAQQKPQENLPTGCTKKELKVMFPNANHRELMDFCNEIQSKHRRGLCGKKYMYHEELSELFTEYTGVPIGYQDTFLSGETYTEVYLRSQERLKFLERLNRN